MYRATNVALGRKVAIKLLSPEYVHIEEDVLRFLREARAAAAIRHPNVVDVLDVARDDDGTPFIVQELLSGEDLEHYLMARDGRLSAEEALELMLPVADAVAAAHVQSVVHRDLKPANIFLARDRNKITPKVLDFGACLFPTLADRSAREVRMLIGTPHYMAPEQIVSKQDVDARADVWTLGVILYELIVGETPFEAETTDAVLQLVQTRDVPPLRERATDAPFDLEALIARCTKRDRLARYADAGALHEDMLEVRRRMRGGRTSSRIVTLTEVANKPTLDVPSAPPPPKPPSLDQPAPPPRRALERPGLLTLSSPGSESPSALDDLDIAPPPSNEPTLGGLRPQAYAQWPTPSSRPPGVAAPSGVRELEPDDPFASASLDLAVEPSSWPPSAKRSSQAPRSAHLSSFPPVLDPRALGVPSRSLPPAPLTRVTPREVTQIPAGVAASSSRPPTPSRSAGTWTAAEAAKLVAFVTVPAIVTFGGFSLVPAITAPVGHALRGESMLASGVLAVAALATATALCARSMLGEKTRWLYLAAAGSVLFAIVMIIVTFAASEAAALGVPHSMGGVATLVAPIAPLALASDAVAAARRGWVDPYSRTEALRSAILASAMLFLALALSPVGAVRVQPRAPQTDQAPHANEEVRRTLLPS